MKILITYSSRTGNTKKIAEAIHEEFKNESEIMPMDKVKNLEGYDYIFIGFWADQANADTTAINFMTRLRDQKVGLFATMGAYPYSMHANDIIRNGASHLDESCKVEGTFICQGKVDPKILSMFEQLPEGHHHAPTPKSRLRQEIASKHPDEEDCAQARKIFRWIVERDVQ